MSIWTKIITALRGGINEAGEAVVDSQALRILDQEVRDASEELKSSKESLASIMARQKVADEKYTDLKKEIAKHEEYAVKALDKGEESLAHEVAVKISDLELQAAQEQKNSQDFKESAEQLKAAVQHAESNLKRMKHQIETVKATESVQRAQSAVAERHSGSNAKMRTAMDSLERIKEKQALKSAQIKAAGELAQESSDDSLHAKLDEAGITTASNANAVLERLKKKQGG